MATQQELLNQASEIRDAELEGENTAVRVGSMLINIIEYMGQFMTSTQLETALQEVSTGLEEWLAGYAQIDSNSGLLDFNHSWFVPLATMGTAFDESPEEYTPAIGEPYYKNQAGYQIFIKTSSSSSVGYPAKVGVVYFNKRTGKSYKWNGSAMVELGTDAVHPHIIDYYSTPAFADIAVGQSYFYTPQGGVSRLAVKTGSDSTFAFDPDPDCIYCFKDTGKTMIWKSSSHSWQQVGGNDTPVNDLTTGGVDKSLSAEMGKQLAQMIAAIVDSGGATRILRQKVEIMRGILKNAVFTNDQSAYFDALDALDEEVESISINQSTLSFNGAGTSQLSATTVPAGVSVAWQSSDASVATVNAQGLVTAVGNGACVITAMAGGMSATCNVTVSGILRQFNISKQLNKISVSPNSDLVAEGSNIDLTFTADSGYAIDDLEVTMGQTDLTANIVMGATGETATLSIASVTGDIAIVGEAIKYSKDYAAGVAEITGFGVGTNGAASVNANISSKAIPLDFGKFYVLTGYDWKNQGGTQSGYNMALCKSDGQGGYTNIIVGTDMQVPTDKGPTSMYLASGDNCKLYGGADTTYLFPVPSKSQFTAGIDEVFLVVNTKYGSNNVNLDISVKELEVDGFREFERGHMGTDNGGYLYKVGSVLCRLYQIEAGKQYSYSGYDWTGGTSMGYPIAIVGVVDGILRSIKKSEVSNETVDTFFEHGTYMTKRYGNNPSGTFAVPAAQNLPSGLTELYVYMAMSYKANESVNTTDFEIHEVQQ